MSGVLKGCAADVEVAAGLSFGRGFVAVVVWAVTACARFDVVWEKARQVMWEVLRRARRWAHCRQIIVIAGSPDVVVCAAVWTVKSMFKTEVSAEIFLIETASDGT